MEALAILFVICVVGMVITGIGAIIQGIRARMREKEQTND